MLPLPTLLCTVGSPCGSLQLSYCSALLLWALLGSFLAQLAQLLPAGPGGFTLLGREGKQPHQGANSALPWPHWAKPCLVTVHSAPEARRHLSSTACPTKASQRRGWGEKKDRVQRMGLKMLCQQPPAREKRSDFWIFLLAPLPQG